MFLQKIKSLSFCNQKWAIFGYFFIKSTELESWVFHSKIQVPDIKANDYWVENSLKGLLFSLELRIRVLNGLCSTFVATWKKVPTCGIKKSIWIDRNSHQSLDKLVGFKSSNFQNQNLSCQQSRKRFFSVGGTIFGKDESIFFFVR